MSKIIIPKKMSGTGNIRDIASQHEDIVIDMQAYRFAVVGPDYYNLGYTRHSTEDGAYRSARNLTRKGYEGIKVLGLDGKQYRAEACVDGLIVDDSAAHIVEL